jgi:hypothetical protein
MSTPSKRVAIIAVAAVLGLTLAACGNSSKSGSGSQASKPDGAVAGPALPAGAAGGAISNDQSKAEPTATPVDPTQLQRSIIYTGSVQVRVDDVDAAAAQAQSVAIGSGGYVGGDNRVIDAKRSTAMLTLRVPASKFASTMDALSHLGTELQRQVSTEDVTAAIIDVASRVKTQQASVDRIRTLLAQAKSVSEIVSIESELTRREADLESLQAQQRSLSDLSSLSTITVTFVGPEAATTVVKKDKNSGFVSGLTSGWHTFVSSVSVLLTILGALLPFLVVVGVPLLVWWTMRRRRRPARPTDIDRPSIPEPPAAG